MQRDMNSMSPNMPNINTMKNMKKSPLTETTIESWFSQEENKLEPLHQKGNWMLSKPEDSMGGMHGGDNMQMENEQ